MSRATPTAATRRNRRTRHMNEQESPTEETIGGDPAEDATSTYDIEADPGQVAEDLGRAGPVQGARRRQRRAPLPAGHVPVPVGRPAHGPRRGVRAGRRHRALLVPAGVRRAAPGRLGLVRAARRERRDQARRAPGAVDRRPTSRPRRSRSAATRSSFDWSTRLHTHDPDVLQVDAVAVPEAVRARPGLPQGRRRSTGARTTRPCWPTSRSSAATASAAAPR